MNVYDEIMELAEQIVPNARQKVAALRTLREAQERFDRVGAYANPYEGGMADLQEAREALGAAKAAAEKLGLQV